MNCVEAEKIADDKDDSKARREKRQSQRVIEKEEITSTEFPEGGNTFYLTTLSNGRE